jgi:hypothetical protein
MLATGLWPARRAVRVTSVRANRLVNLVFKRFAKAMTGFRGKRLKSRVMAKIAKKLPASILQDKVPCDKH